MAFDGKNDLVGIPFRDTTVIPVFTSPDEIGENDPIIWKAVYLQDNLETLISLKKHLLVNPFSNPEKQFFVPYEAIEKMLKPLIDRKSMQK
jgi:hypothetical protein